MATSQNIFTMVLDRNLREEVRVKAKSKGLTVAALIRHLLINWLEAEYARNKAITIVPAAPPLRITGEENMV